MLTRTYVIVARPNAHEQLLLRDFVEAVNEKRYDNAIETLWELATAPQIAVERAQYYGAWYSDIVNKPRRRHIILKNCARRWSREIE
ncbi:MAG: hypothetical protein QXY15_04485 [Candidatus Nitrosotenuis sp.]